MIVSKTGSTSTSATTTSSNKRLSGLVSGLDTDSLVKQLSAGTQNKIDKQAQSKQIAQWQQSSYREVIKALTEFQTKYFSTTTSGSSILNPGFFTSTAIKNSSPFLNVTGNANAAKNMAISGISQLAIQAALTSSHAVTKKSIDTGTLSDSWSKAAGTSMTINYGGKDYKLFIPNDFNITKDAAPEQINEVLTALNTAVTNTTGLSGNVEFGYADGKVTLTKKGSADKISITDGSSTLLAGLGLTKGASNETAITGTDANADYFLRSTVPAGSTLKFHIGDTDYTVTTTADTSISSDKTVSDVQTMLNNAIAADDTLKGINLKATVDGTGVISFTSDKGSVSVTGGSQCLYEGLGFKSGTNKVDRAKLLTSYLGDTLAGSTLTFDLDGTKKYITFDESDRAQFSTLSGTGLKDYIQIKLNTQFGAGKISVGFNNNSLSFTTADANSILTLSSSDKSGVLGMDGAMRVYAGETNRVNINKTLGDIFPNLNTPLTPTTENGSTYDIIINDQTFTFKNTDTIDTVIKTINSDVRANVNVAYSSVTDTFSITAKDGGSSSRVDIKNSGNCNLATVLFGTSAEQKVQSGQDAIMKVSFNGGDETTITRPDNKFTLDGVNFELLSTTDTTVSADKPIKFTADSQTDKLYDKIKSFVDDYNSIITLCTTKINERQSANDKYLPLTDDQKAQMTETQITEYEKKAKVGILNSDPLLSNLCLNLRKAMTDQVDSVKGALFEIGIATKANDYSGNGQITVDETKLKNALTNDPDKVAALFTDSDGVAYKMQSVINDNIKTTGGSGLLVAKAGLENSTTYDNSALTQKISDYTKTIKDLQTRLKDEQDRYYSKFTKLEQYISQMNAQSGIFTNFGTSS